MVFHGILKDRNSLQFSRTLLNILTNVNNAAFCRVFFFDFQLLLFFPKPLETVPSVPIRTDINFTLMFHTLFCFLAKTMYLSIFSFCFFFYFHSVFRRNGKIHQITSSLLLSCLNFCDEACWFLSLRVFGLSSSLFLFPPRFGWYVLRPSSGVCRTREPSRNFELRPLLNPRGSPVLIPLAITGYKC